MDISYDEYNTSSEDCEVGNEFVFFGMHMRVDGVDNTDPDNVVLTCTIIEDRDKLEAAVLTMPKKSRVTVINK